MNSVFDSPVTVLKGVGDVRAKAFAKLKIFTVGDLLYHFPRAYQNRGDVVTLAEAAEKNDDLPHSFMLTVSCEPTVRMIRRGMTIIKFKAFDESGAAEITYFNQAYVKDIFHTGAEFRFWGKVTKEGRSLKMSSPIAEAVGPKPLTDIVPVYPLTSSLTQKYVSGCLREALRLVSRNVADFMPSSVLESEGLCTLDYALTNIHFPESDEARNAALRRLCFDEIFTVAVALASSGSKKKTSGAISMENTDISGFLGALPYELTGAQKRSVGEIIADMKTGVPMNRILTGDVGSGKTAVAQAAAYVAAMNGCRTALMAPTEILANQHYADFAELFGRLGLRCELLTGATTAAKRRRIFEGLLSKGTDRIDVVIGTHALLGDDVRFDRLGLVITDEQHRFGVMQRAALADKSKSVHTLVMSATPVPRTLSLVIYGDLDSSRLDEMPSGRQKVDTFVVDEAYRARLNGFIRKQVGDGHQVYIICPAVEEAKQADIADSEEMTNMDIFGEMIASVPPLKSAVAYADALAAEMSDIRVGLVHGKLKSSQKDAVMTAFAAGEIDVLVSTTVIEVGVNVPNATLMIVENAERFGLSQLHQIRGRVGRGKAKSYCILVSDAKDEKSRRRLDIMHKSNDGFRIAEEDLLLRGPGDFFGSEGEFRQSGGLKLKLTAGCTDISLITSAAQAGRALIGENPTLAGEELVALKSRVDAMRSTSENTIN